VRQASATSHWQTVAGRRLLWVTASAPAGDDPSAEVEAARAFEIAMVRVAAAGLSSHAIVRSRVRGLTPEARVAASGVRHSVVSGDRRAASSSFVDRLASPSGRQVSVELAVLDGPTGSKVVEERDPPVQACLWVNLEGLLFLSGLTYAAADLDTQLDGIFAALRSSLDRSGLGAESVRQLTVFHQRSIAPERIGAAVAERTPSLTCPIEWIPVDGFSSAEKIVEIEFTFEAATS
jgi:hypothetical protein